MGWAKINDQKYELLCSDGLLIKIIKPISYNTWFCSYTTKHSTFSSISGPIKLKSTKSKDAKNEALKLIRENANSILNQTEEI